MAHTLTAADVQKVALLSRLKLSEAEITRFAAQLGNVLTYIEQLNEVAVDGVQPQVHAVEIQNVLREDALKDSLPRDKALANAPKSDGKYFLVPPILGGD